MKKKFLVAAIFALGLCKQVNAQRVVIIGFDGFSAEGFKEINHPNIDALFANGAITNSNRPVMPSVTLPNWTSHLTSQGPEEHGVTGNDWTLQKHTLNAIEVDEDGYTPSIFKVLKDQKPNVKTAYYYNWAQLINPINKKYLDEVSFEEKDAYTENYMKAIKFIENNKKSPSLTFLYSVHTDHAGHGHGWMSPEYITAVEAADVAVGELVAKLKSDGLFEDTYFFLITDHGGIKNGHGGISMKEMQTPWGVVGPKIKKLGLTDSFFSSNRNTAATVAKIFGIKELPKSWNGVAPKEVFK